jgi:arylformamidase
VLLGTSINEALKLDVTAARRASPLQTSSDDTAAPSWAALRGFAPAVVCWGEIETDAFEHQSRAFAAALKAADVGCDCFEVPSRNHFDIVLELVDARSRLGRHTLRLLGLTEP